eukprot:Plantae.Rhodophyta-Hildenbrandia_rubra.ctg1198.p1 GENE.Plantae.Rhodophyta-Hildenbrandia_rubra.ctg1198~~Plantae.Rhodophyta-Hildenbrandia_rubra.ctg1198.p1  ORF type:complete len:451 (-),score=118.20 Plantae.Rhodophyta-Hildenbrandia_rubra.ctg1198:4100-5452(-)
MVTSTKSPAPITKTNMTTTTSTTKGTAKSAKDAVTPTNPSTTAHRVHPVHSIKRLSASITTRKSTLNNKISSDFTDHRTQLDNAETTLKEGLKRYEDSKLCWDGVGKNMELFNEGLMGVKGTGDNKVLFDKGYDSAVGFRRGVSGGAMEEAEGLKGVKGYLEEIAELKKEYPNVERLWSEMERYRKKNERMEKKKNLKEEKKLRSVTKMENSRKAYHVAVDETVEKMKRCLDKYASICRGLFAAYWKKQGDYALALEKNTKVVQGLGARDLTQRKSLGSLTQPKTTSSVVPTSVEKKDVLAAPTILPKTEATIAPKVIEPTVEKVPEITATQDPNTVVPRTTPAPVKITNVPAPVKTTTVETVTSAPKSSVQEAPAVKKMEEKISNAAKVPKDNAKPIEVSKVKQEVPPGTKSPSKFTKSARLPSFKKMFRRSTPATTTTTTATPAPTAA